MEQKEEKIVGAKKQGKEHVRDGLQTRKRPLCGNWTPKIGGGLPKGGKVGVWGGLVCVSKTDILLYSKTKEKTTRNRRRVRRTGVRVGTKFHLRSGEKVPAIHVIMEGFITVQVTEHQKRKTRSDEKGEEWGK